MNPIEFTKDLIFFIKENAKMIKEVKEEIRKEEKEKVKEKIAQLRLLKQQGN